MTLLIPLLVAVVTAAVCSYIASTTAPRSKRRARGHFVLGFCCGVAAGALLRRRVLRAARSAIRTTGFTDILRTAYVESALGWIARVTNGSPERSRGSARRRTYASARAILGR